MILSPQVVTSLIFIIMSIATAQPIRYVRPNDPSHQDCISNQSACLTLDQYAEQAASYFTMGATFLFLAGNHSLEKNLSLINIADLTMKGIQDSGFNVNVLHRNGRFIICENVTRLHFEGLAFTSQVDSSSSSSSQNTSLFVISNAQEVTMLNMTFKGSGDLNKGTLRAMYMKNSTLEIVSCYFEGNTAFDGGALYVDVGSHVTLSGSIFRENKASRRGAAIYATESTIILKETLGNCITHNSAQDSGGGIFCMSCRLYIEGKLETADTEEATMKSLLVPHSTVFSSNQAQWYGGGIFIAYSIALFSATNIMFANNSASKGGALSSQESFVVFGTRHLSFTGNTVSDLGGAVYANSGDGRIGYLSFIGENDQIFIDDILDGGDIKFPGNDVMIDRTNCTEDFSSRHVTADEAANTENGYFESTFSNISFSYNSAKRGGAIYTKETKLNTTAECMYFTNNTALEAGGAIIAFKGYMSIGATGDTYQYFADNTAEYGGAIYQEEGFLEINGYNHFTRNYAKLDGGAIYKNRFKFIISCRALFTDNSAGTGSGGAIALLEGNTLIIGTIIEFINNKARGTVSKGGRTALGGAIFANNSQIISYSHQFSFTGNFAKEIGGAIATRFGSELTVLAANFTDNTAGEEGGAVYAEKIGRVTLNFTNATGNSKSALCLRQSNTSIGGNSTMEGNFGEKGGCFYIAYSYVVLREKTIFRNNSAELGGVIYGFNGANIYIRGLTIFEENTASRGGGAIYAVDTDIILRQTVEFNSNSAQNGGAMSFHSGATLTVLPLTRFNTTRNSASDYGGVIYYDDSSISSLQCDYDMNNTANTKGLLFSLPYCFLDLQKGIVEYENYTLNRFLLFSFNNSAGKGGNYMYGGLTDKCQVFATAKNNQMASVTLNQVLVGTFHDVDSKTDSELIYSEPYLLCFCDRYTGERNCYSDNTVHVYRGQTFSVSVVALAQGGVHSSAIVTAKLSQTGRLKLDQSTQPISQDCTDVTYNVYSTEESVALVLYPNGPCIDRGLATAVVNVTLMGCPDAFTRHIYDEQCTCEERLQAYGANCTIDDDIQIIKNAGSKFWMDALYENESYVGLILYRACPFNYCKKGNVFLSLQDSDIQCDVNRSGVLCGSCTTNYSLMLGSSKCQVCSNDYLALLLPFIASGIALVAFLSILRLTVASGSVNTMILYANVVQANKRVFLPNTINILTVFIAWLNLDLGFPTCFYHGMTAYAQTWLQFAFPLYVWILIGLIIFVSRYSITLSKLIGHNPIAVLATLLLMSYAKILKVIIEVYSSVELDYPDNKTVTVWLKDANVPYLKSWHLFLTVATSLILAFLFLPYTIFLLLGHKLYRCFGRRRLQWLNRIKPLLDPYYAPYKTSTRYWTGLLLLVRCALYIVFSFDSFGGVTKSPLAINIAFTTLVVIAWISGRIYKNLYSNFVAASVYLNLIILSTTSLAGINTPEIKYALVGMVFVIMIVIVLYQLHSLYIAKTLMWLRFNTWVLRLVARIKRAEPHGPDNESLIVSSHDQHRIPTQTVMHFREGLLELETSFSA